MTKLTLLKINNHKWSNCFIGLKFIGKCELTFSYSDIVAYDRKNLIVKTTIYKQIWRKSIFKEQIIHKLKIIRKYK